MLFLKVHTHFVCSSGYLDLNGNHTKLTNSTTDYYLHVSVVFKTVNTLITKNNGNTLMRSY